MTPKEVNFREVCNTYVANTHVRKQAFSILWYLKAVLANIALLTSIGTPAARRDRRRTASARAGAAALPAHAREVRGQFRHPRANVLNFH